MASRDRARGALVNTLKQQQQASQTTTIIVNSDKGVAVERLVAVMDNLRRGGFLSVSIATQEAVTCICSIAHVIFSAGCRR